MVNSDQWQQYKLWRSIHFLNPAGGGIYAGKEVYTFQISDTLAAILVGISALHPGCRSGLTDLTNHS